MVVQAKREKFSLREFRALFKVIRKGEKTEGMAASGLSSGFSSKRNRGGRIGMTILVGFSVVMFGALFFFMGLGFGLAGLPAQISTTLMVLTLVAMAFLIKTFYAVSVLYFSKDIGYYLTLPFSGPSVLWAKFAHYFMNSFLSDLMLAALPIGCLVGLEAPIGDYLVFIPAFICCSVATNFVFLIVIVAALRFSRLAANKDRFQQFFGAIIVVVALVIGVSSQVVMRVFFDNTATAAQMLTDQLTNPLLMLFLGVLCPPWLLSSWLFGHGVLASCGALVGMIVLVAALGWLLNACSSRWYFEGVRGVQGGGAARERRALSNAELQEVARSHGQLGAQLARDWRLVLRTPTFFNQFVLSALLMPLYMLAIILVVGFLNLSEDGMSFAEVLEHARFMVTIVASEPGMFTIGALILLGVLGFMSAGDYGMLLAVSRDGDDFFWMRGLPVDWRSYLLAKGLVSGGLSTLPILFILLVAAVVLLPPVELALYYFGLAVLFRLVMNVVVLGCGARFPVLDWESDEQLVKSSVGRVYASILAGLVSAIPPILLLAGGIVGLYPPLVGMIAAPIVLIAAGGAALWWTFGPVATRLSRLER